MSQAIKIRFEHGDITRYRNLKKISIEEYNKMIVNADIAFIKEMEENREKYKLDHNVNSSLDIYVAETVSPDGSYYCQPSCLIMRGNNLIEVLAHGFGRMFVGHSIGTIFNN